MATWSHMLLVLCLPCVTECSGIYSSQSVRETLCNEPHWQDSSHRQSQKREIWQLDHIKIRQVDRNFAKIPPTCCHKQHENKQLERVGFLQPQWAFQSQNLLAHSGYLAPWKLHDLRRKTRHNWESKRRLSNLTQENTHLHLQQPDVLGKKKMRKLKKRKNSLGLMSSGSLRRFHCSSSLSLIRNPKIQNLFQGQRFTC